MLAGTTPLKAGMFKMALNEAGIDVDAPWITLISRVLLLVLGTATALVFLLKREIYDAKANTDD